MEIKELFEPKKRKVKHFIKFLLKNEVYHNYVTNLDMFMNGHPTLIARYEMEGMRGVRPKFPMDRYFPCCKIQDIIDKTLHWRYTNESHNFWFNINVLWQEEVEAKKI